VSRGTELPNSAVGLRKRIGDGNFKKKPTKYHLESTRQLYSVLVMAFA